MHKFFRRLVFLDIVVCLVFYVVFFIQICGWFEHQFEALGNAFFIYASSKFPNFTIITDALYHIFLALVLLCSGCYFIVLIKSKKLTLINSLPPIASLVYIFCSVRLRNYALYWMGLQFSIDNACLWLGVYLLFMLALKYFSYRKLEKEIV